MTSRKGKRMTELSDVFMVYMFLLGVVIWRGGIRRTWEEVTRGFDKALMSVPIIKYWIERWEKL
jgi:hypothetical protein